MKSKLYEEERDHDSKYAFNGIFSKLHQQQPTPLHHTTSTAAVDCIPAASNREEEEEEDSSGHIHKPAARRIIQEGHTLPTLHDGATIEVVRRPRGRPPGSRNKPKPQSIISKTPSEPPCMSPYILELPPGVDVIAATTHFCQKRKLSLCILTGSGAVANITIKQPSATPGSAAVTFHGRFDILSIYATVLDQSGVDFPVNGQFTLYVAAGPQGQVVGGVVVGPMVSAATVYLVAGTFTSPSFCRLQHDDDDEDTSRNGEGDDAHEYPTPVSGGAVEHCQIGSLYKL